MSSIMEAVKEAVRTGEPQWVGNLKIDPQKKSR